MTSLERRAWSRDGVTLREVACNLCEATERRGLSIENGLAVVRCLRCGLVYVTPQPSADELAGFYDEYYPAESEAGWLRLMAHAIERDARQAEALVGGKGRLLDVGAGFGHFLAAMRERGWQVTGVESSTRAAERLRAKGLAVLVGRVPAVELPERRFDVVTASSVLEHVADPLGVLEQAFRVLRPGGWALMRVPNVALLSLFFPMRRLESVRLVRALMRVVRKEIMDEDNLFYVIDPPAHLFGFDHRTLRAAFERAGFADVTVRGDPMPVRGDACNALIDGAVYAGAEAVTRLSGGRVMLAPNVTAWGRRPPEPAVGTR